MTATMKDAQIQTGQRVHCILYGGRSGIVCAIHGDQSPESIRTFGGGCISSGGTAYLDVVFDNGTVSRRIPEGIVRGVQWTIYDAIATPEEIAEALAFAQSEGERRAAEALAESKQQTAERAAHSDNFPHLIRHADRHGWSEGRLAAENVRRCLKREFPAVKFKVTSDHNSVNVRWECGPTPAQVEAITDRFKGYSGNTFADVFGGPTYVSTARDYPAPGFDAVCRQLADWYRVPYEGRNTRTEGQYITDIAHRILNHSPLGASLSGLDRVPGVTCGSAEDFWTAR